MKGFPKPIKVCFRLVTQPNFVCLLIRTCCNTAKCGLLQVLGTTTLVLRLQTSFVSLAALSPT